MKVSMYKKLQYYQVKTVEGLIQNEKKKLTTDGIAIT